MFAGIWARTSSVLFLILVSASTAWGQDPAGHQTGLFEFRTGTIRLTLPVLVVDATGGVLLPTGEVLNLLGISHQVSSDGAAIEIPLQPTEQFASLNATSGVITRRREVRDLGTGDVLIHGGDIFISTELMGWLLGGSATVDWGELVISLERDAPFPVEVERRSQQRLELARQLLARASDAGPAESVAMPASSGGGVFEWGVTTSSTQPFRGASLRGGLGLAVLGGALNLSVQGTPGMESDASALRGTAVYRRVFPEGRLIRSVELGEMMAGNVFARGVRGITVSNVRRIRDPLYGPITVNPDMPEGWEFEVYRGGELVGFSSTDSEAVVVPLRYGANPFRVRMISPTGEVVISDLPLHVPVSQLRAGDFEYTTGVGTCPENACGVYTFLNGDLGLTRWLTVGSGIEYLQSDDEHVVRGHGDLSMASLHGLLTNIRIAPGRLTEARISYSGDRRVSAHAAGGIAHREAAQPSYQQDQERRLFADAGVGFQLPAGYAGLRNLRFTGRIDAPSGGDAFWRIGGFTSFQRWYHDVRYESSPEYVSDLISLRSTWITPLTWLRPFRSTSISGAAGARGADVEFVEMSAALQALGGGSAFLSGRWTARTNSPSLQVGFTRSFGAARMQTRLAHFASSTQASVALDGALVVGSPKGVLTSSTSGTGLAGVGGRVFLDHNRNGIFDEGDQAADSVPVIAGSFLVRTDTEGRYSAWGLAPYERLAIGVDTLNISSPNWVPLEGRQIVRLVPNVVRRIDIPLVRTVELVGRLIPTEGVMTTAGVTVELHDEETDTTTPVLTFSDGQFYVSRLRPGEYRITVAASSLAALRARADPEVLHFTVGGEEVLDLPPITLHRTGGFDFGPGREPPSR